MGIVERGRGTAIRNGVDTEVRVQIGKGFGGEDDG